jgi:hypothetical protein
VAGSRAIQLWRSRLASRSGLCSAWHYDRPEGLIGSIIALLGLDLAIPDHTTLSRRAETLTVPRPKMGKAPIHLLVDSIGLRMCGPGEWLLEKHGSKRRRSWRKLHIGVDADTGQIVAAELTSNDVDDGSQVGPLLDQIAVPVASFTGDGAYDRRGETIDHVGFRLKDYDGHRRKLKTLGIPYSTMDLPELGERRLFIRTPTGILIERVFREGDAASNPKRSEQYA